MYYESNNNYLAHHGILGQKWGVRRFQNKDGTRTPLGRKRERENNKVDHDKLVKSTNAKELNKNRDQLSDKELQDRLNRMRNEQALEQMANANINIGKQYAKQIFADSGKEIVKEIAKGAMKPVIAAGIAAGTTWVKTGGVQKLLVSVALSSLLVGDIAPGFEDRWNI